MKIPFQHVIFFLKKKLTLFHTFQSYVWGQFLPESATQFPGRLRAEWCKAVGFATQIMLLSIRIPTP